MEELHNQITGLIVHNISNKKVKVSDVVLVLEIIKQDLVKQMTSSFYKKQPIEVIKKPTKIGEKHGVSKNNT